MTRNEAMNLIRITRIPEGDFACDIVTALDALGLVKLDEPKSADNKLADILAAYVPGIEVESIWREIDEAGLKITDK